MARNLTPSQLALAASLGLGIESVPELIAALSGAREAQDRDVHPLHGAVHGLGGVYGGSRAGEGLGRLLGAPTGAMLGGAAGKAMGGSDVALIGALLGGLLGLRGGPGLGRVLGGLKGYDVGVGQLPRKEKRAFANPWAQALQAARGSKPLAENVMTAGRTAFRAKNPTRALPADAAEAAPHVGRVIRGLNRARSRPKLAYSIAAAIQCHPCSVCEEDHEAAKEKLGFAGYDANCGCDCHDLRHYPIPEGAVLRALTKEAMTRSTALGLAAQAWCTEANRHKVLDPELAKAFGKILHQHTR